MNTEGDNARQVKRVKVVDLLTYKIKGAATLQDALDRDLRHKYGSAITIEFYVGLEGDGRPLADLNGKLVIGEPRVAVFARVMLPTPAVQS